MTAVAGVDGCPQGWIANVLSDDRSARAEISPTFADLLPYLTDAGVIAVDIPIDLPDGPDPRCTGCQVRRTKIVKTNPRFCGPGADYAKNTQAGANSQMNVAPT